MNPPEDPSQRLKYLYDLLGVAENASKAEIKKAYHKAALKYHPDKVSEDEREESADKFKNIQMAYEVLSDEDKKQEYQRRGTAAFGAGGEGVNMEDILAQMFGMGSMGGGARRPRRGPDEEQHYPVTLEELYKGKTVKFQAQKKVICSGCSGSGAKPGVKVNKCDKCRGNGAFQVIRQVAPGLARQELRQCDKCMGSGNDITDKDRCKKCKGQRTMEETKTLEIYIPRGSKQGDRIVLEGEADQQPDQQPGDIVFVLVEQPHSVFSRVGRDLSAPLKITLSEALCGFSRVVIKHLDGRGIHIKLPRGKILCPEQVLRVANEGMPVKRSDAKGDLYLIVKVEFPANDWLQNEKQYAEIQKLLPPPNPAPVVEEVDEVEYDDGADLDEMGTRGETHAGEWEDEEEHTEGPQCAAQ